MKLDGRRMLVTGGSAGIGQAIAAAGLERGMKVVINGRDAARLDVAAKALGIPGVAGDVGKPAEAQRIVAESVSAMGGLDVLINNAGWGRRMPVAEIDAELFHAMWETNVLGAALMAQAALPHLDGGGDIVNVASTAGGRGYANGTAYCSTKFALRGMTECWQAELRPRDIRVICINPSEVQTGFGGRDPERPKDPHKLISEDIAQAVMATLEMEPRGL
ncbi:MAG: SDR family NAD(P)-dependent oxidoreductase, partial [Planctomycetes bacterium]|nr:SDR family NAD(P)-dependent oxidoreductase [Planctomycetota bacterium]